MRLFLNASIFVGMLALSAAAQATPSLTTRETQLEKVEEEINSDENSAAEDANVLEPIYIEGESADIEVFGQPETEPQTEEAFEATPGPADDGDGVEAIRLEIPVD